MLPIIMRMGNPSGIQLILLSFFSGDFQMETYTPLMMLLLLTEDM